MRRVNIFDILEEDQDSIVESLEEEDEDEEDEEEVEDEEDDEDMGFYGLRRWISFQSEKLDDRLMLFWNLDELFKPRKKLCFISPTFYINQNKKIDWKKLSLSTHPHAIFLLEQNQDKIDWDNLSLNPAAIHLLEQNQDKINWERLSANENIYTYNYCKIKKNCNIFKEELIAYVYNPSRIFKNVNDESDIDMLLDNI